MNGHENITIANENRSSEEARENGRKGGIASGQARRQAKTLKELAQTVANSPIKDAKLKKKIQNILPLEDDELTGNAAVVAGVYSQTVKGEMKAVEKWDQWMERDKGDDKRFEIPARVVGKAFVDINREIIPNITYVFKGGRGGLKSSYISLKVIELLRNNPNMHACAVRKVSNTLKDSVYAQLKWAINEMGLEDEFSYTKSPVEITYKKTGQKIYFRGCDDPTKLKSLKPEFGYIGILWIEELDQIEGEEEERSINQSVIRGGDISYVFESFNPPKTADAWVNRREKIPNPKRIVHTSTYLDAPKQWLGQKFIDDAEHLKEVNPTAYEHEYLGVANGTGGAVFENLEVREITNEEVNSFDRIFNGVDFGWFPDQFAFIRSYYDSDKETIYLIDELYVNKWSNEKTAEWIKSKGYDDYVIICDSAEPKSINDYRDMGLPARGAIKGPGSIDYGFKWLQIRKIIIDPRRTPNAYNEITSYEYERDKQGNVISGYPDGNDHIISALRYSYEPLFNKRGTSA